MRRRSSPLAAAVMAVGCGSSPSRTEARPSQGGGSATPLEANPAAGLDAAGTGVAAAQPGAAKAAEDEWDDPPAEDEVIEHRKAPVEVGADDPVENSSGPEIVGADLEAHVGICETAFDGSTDPYLAGARQR